MREPGKDGRCVSEHWERSMAIGIWAAVGALAPALGPVVGGLISQHLRCGLGLPSSTCRSA